MLSHRFRDFWNESEFESPAHAPVACGAVAAFVPCPCPVVQSMTSLQQAQTEQLYRLAYEQAQSQVVLNRRARYLDFSMN